MRALSLRWIIRVRESPRSPVAIENLAGDGGNLFGRHGADGAQEYRDDGEVFADDFAQSLEAFPASASSASGFSPSSSASRRMFCSPGGGCSPRSILLR